MDDVIIVAITTMGGAFMAGLFAIIQQFMAARESKRNVIKQDKANKDTKDTLNKNQNETEKSFDKIMEILERQQKVIENLQLIVDGQQKSIRVQLRDRLQFVLKSFQDKESVTYAERENVIDMHNLYKANGDNGAVTSMFEKFMEKKVV